MLLRTGNSRMIVGYDLGGTFCRISYFSQESSKVETVSNVVGKECYNIPVALWKKSGVNQWLYGREALKAAEGDGILIENLLELALDGEMISVEGEPYDPVGLLTLFVRRSLGLLSMIGPMERIGALLVTCDRMDERLTGVLGQVFSQLKLKSKRIFFQNYEESFYYYMLHQPEELRSYPSLLMWYEKDRIKVCRMGYNRKTTPIAAFTACEEYPFLDMEDLPETENLLRLHQERMDREFLNLLEKICGEELISPVYLIGECFSGGWMKESLKYLCKGRRVFQGSNLFSKGACLGMMERLKPSPIGRKYVFLGEDKLKANVGMRILRRGEDSYCALLDAGVSLSEAHNSCEFYMRDGRSFELVVTPLNGRKGKLVKITLDGLVRQAVRLKLQVRVIEEQRLLVEVEDLGFGELIPSTHQTWTEEFELYE